MPYKTLVRANRAARRNAAIFGVVYYLTVLTVANPVELKHHALLWLLIVPLVVGLIIMLLTYASETARTREEDRR